MAGLSRPPEPAVPGRMIGSAEAHLHMGRIGSGMGQDSHRIQSDAPSSEWRQAVKAAGYVAPWIIAMVLAAALLGPIAAHGFIDHTHYVFVEATAR